MQSAIYIYNILFARESYDYLTKFNKSDTLLMMFLFCFDFVCYTVN